MLQFYFLSIVCNLFAGYALLAETETKSAFFEGIKSYVLDETFRLVLGVLTMIVGLFKILSVIRGDIPVIGDLFPAALGIMSGFALLFEFYKSRSHMSDETIERLDTLITHYRKWIGFGAVITAGVHFLFPTVLFL
ncbi:MAG: hypothetical protein SNJ56_03105 [Termitinemataceae bacterium]